METRQEKIARVNKLREAKIKKQEVINKRVARENKIDEYAYNLVTGYNYYDSTVPFSGWEDYAKSIIKFINELDEEKE